MMRREFVEDGWRFRVTKRGTISNPTKIIVQFYDNTLHNPEVDDVYRVEETVEETVAVEKERTLFGRTLWTYEDTETRTRSIEDTVEIAMERAWEKIDQIDENPSERFDDAVDSVRGDQ